MPRFIALPVGQGDAFLLETDKGTVLVDGGRAVKSFAHLFKTYAQRDGVDVLVATHNDADHANGVLGFLEAGFKCNELWLPGRWVQVLPHVLRPWEEVVVLLAKQAKQVANEFEEWTPYRPLLEQYAEFASSEVEESQDFVVEKIEVDESGWPYPLITNQEKTFEDDLSGELFWRSRSRVWPTLLGIRYLPERVLFCEAIAAAKRIRQIALEAFHRGLPVRWFVYDPTRPAGGETWLKPLNAREIARVTPIPESQRVTPIPESQLLACLALTVWNKESFVLWAPPPYAGPGVLFTADSDLKDVSLPVLKGAIVTAPHHGSENNRSVYQLVMQNSVSEVVWVRSDGNFRKRPCKEYIRAPGKRFCTLCRNSTRPKQAVVLFVQSNIWVPDERVHPCSCK